MNLYHCDRGPVYNGEVFNRTALIKYLFEKKKFKSYLEIGHGQGHNWSKMGFIQNKKCVDPFTGPLEVIRKTSDAFFLENKETYDLIFIDGDHSAEQVYKDIVNSLKVLNAGGIILTHDNCPPEKIHENYEACGTSWRTIPLLRIRDDLDICVLNSDLGIGVIRKKENSNKFNVKEDDLIYTAINQDKSSPDFSIFHYEWLDNRRVELLNLLELNDFLKWIGE